MGPFRASVWAALAHVALAGKFSVLQFIGKNSCLGRVDPIISPGQVSQHVHGVNGGINFGYNIAGGGMINSKCTSSKIAGDKSAYWAPYLYFQDPSDPNVIESVPVYYMNVYYFYDDDTVPFPPGLSMVAGNPYLRNPPTSGTGDLNWDAAKGDIQPVQIHCPYNENFYPAGSNGLNGAGVPASSGTRAKGAGFGDKYCNGQYSPMQLTVHFPYCYNTAAGLDNYKENMKYPMNAGSKTECSSYGPTWVKVPHLFYEIYHDTQPFNSRWKEGTGTSPWRLANGDPTGYGFHGDFIAGWDEQALKDVIAHCDRSPVNGVFQDEAMSVCSISGGLNSQDCPCDMQMSVSEQVSGKMTALPGNNPIGKWGVADPRATQTGSTQASGGPSTSPTSVSYTNPVTASQPHGSSVATTTPSMSSSDGGKYTAPVTTAPVTTKPTTSVQGPMFRPTITSTTSGILYTSIGDECGCADNGTSMHPTAARTAIYMTDTVLETLTVYETISCAGSPSAPSNCVSVGERGPFASGVGGFGLNAGAMGGGAAMAPNNTSANNSSHSRMKRHLEKHLLERSSPRRG